VTHLCSYTRAIASRSRSSRSARSGTPSCRDTRQRRVDAPWRQLLTTSLTSADADELQTSSVSPQIRSGIGAYAYGQSGVDFEQRIDFDRLRVDRLHRAQRLLGESHMDALLVFRDENVRFLTGLRAQLLAGKSAQLNGVLVTADRDPILLISGGDLERARASMPWITELHQVPILEDRGLIAGVVTTTLAPILRRLDLGAATVGIDECSYALILELQSALPELILDHGDALMHRCRRVKSVAEVAVMQGASTIAEALTSTAIAAIRPGVRETEVAGEAMRESLPPRRRVVPRHHPVRRLR
jgi:hypothetical protein